MNDIVVVKGENLTDWDKRKIKERTRRYCKSKNIDLLLYVSE